VTNNRKSTDALRTLSPRGPPAEDSKSELLAATLVNSFAYIAHTGPKRYRNCGISSPFTGVREVMDEELSVLSVVPVLSYS
jgi:hypothetical protein